MKVKHFRKKLDLKTNEKNNERNRKTENKITCIMVSDRNIYNNNIYYQSAPKPNY